MTNTKTNKGAASRVAFRTREYDTNDNRVKIYVVEEFSSARVFLRVSVTRPLNKNKLFIKLKNVERYGLVIWGYTRMLMHESARYVRAQVRTCQNCTPHFEIDENDLTGKTYVSWAVRF